MNDFIFAFSAFALGALHALEPGHGKTVVAAYLVGSKGRVQDAIVLGGIVTFTHTFSIIVLGVLTAVAASYFVPETVHGVLEVVSGLLIVGVGLWMVNDRIIKGRKDRGHSHDHGSHDHHGHSHALPPGEKPSLGSLITLGISGGIVPCPAGLALLLAAVAVGNVVGGVSLVVVFSLGLGVVLVAIGIAMVKTAGLAGRLFGSQLGDGRLAARAGMVSAVVVTCVGLAMTVRAVLDVASLGPLT